MNKIGSPDELAVVLESYIRIDFNSPAVIEIIFAREIYSFHFNCSKNEAFISDPDSATKGCIKILSLIDIIKPKVCSVCKYERSKLE